MSSSTEPYDFLPLDDDTEPYAVLDVDTPPPWHGDATRETHQAALHRPTADVPTTDAATTDAPTTDEAD